jgi:hypothetical protein
MENNTMNTLSTSRQQARLLKRQQAKQMRSALRKEVRTENAKRGKDDFITTISNDWRTYYA